MTHQVHPFAHRLGIIRDWKSRWFHAGAQYKVFLRSDVLLREYLKKQLRGMYVSSIEMERNNEVLKVIIKTARPGMIIGRQGEGSVKLKRQIEAFLSKIKIPTKEIKLEIEEIRSPESDAGVVSQMIAEGLEKRLPFRRVIKQTIEKVSANKQVKGVRVVLSGRLGGADMSRKEKLKWGMVPLQTFRADVDFAREKAYLPYGTIGVKVWIYRGEIFADKKEGQQK
ncbi:MAG: 30S ribosomal protein S3 [Parcubacteria group bacterium]|nr:30S ribosomal protein S3 [Parcubacteria group bacterium]